MKAAILGADAGALAAALAIARLGIEVEVMPADAEPDPDLAVALPPNATRILRALGLGEPLAAYGERIELVQVRSPKRGALIAWQPRGAMLETRYGAPYLELSQRALVGLLRDALATRGIRIGPPRATGHPDIDADLLVGAAATLPGECPLVSEATPWRLHQGTSPATAIDVAAFGHAGVWPGIASYFDYLEIGPRLHWRAIVPRTERLESAFAGWAGAVTTVISAATSASSHEVRDFQPLQSWHGERWVLIGNACHPLLPHAKFDTALAIEDAWVLAHMLDVYEDEIAGATREFERHRKPRADRAQAWARRFAAACHPGRRSRWWRRNLALATGCRFLPELALERDDWLYGYNAVRHYG